jgi:DNA polymerase III delta prime subunit
MRTKRFLLVLIVIFIVAITARWWLPAMLTILSVNSDLIQTIDSVINIVSTVVVVVSALGGYLLLRDQKTGNEESLDQRNRRILLNHVENFWVKGVLEKSLHGAAMLELGIKEDPEAVTYPWAIKKEATDETLPAGMSMLEIFEQIGMGRSLLILGAPGSGKTTMLLELARQLIERARQNADEPIPMVFNLASWTEKLSLTDWLAQELNNIYYVPRKTAPDWVKGNKLLLLLDGLDEVRQESRAKCVDAINQFRKEHGLTSLAVCSRSQDYEDIHTRLAFDGAIEIQPLTQEQVTTFFNRFGKEMAGLKQVLKKDSALREMAETPLFLSIMMMAYRGRQDVDVLVSQDIETQRKHLFDNYIERMFERPRSENTTFKKQDVLRWLSWVAIVMTNYNAIPYLLENTKPEWLSQKRLRAYRFTIKSSIALIITLILGLAIGSIYHNVRGGLITIIALSGLIPAIQSFLKINKIEMAEALELSLPSVKEGLYFLLIIWIIIGLITGSLVWLFTGKITGLYIGLYNGLFIGILFGLIGGLSFGIRPTAITQTTFPGQNISSSVMFSFIVFMIFVFIFEVFSGLDYLLEKLLFNNLSNSLINVPFDTLTLNIYNLLLIGIFAGLLYGGYALIQHYVLRFFLTRDNLLPGRLIPFLDYCTDLIFLRRVGGGYIFVHRLLMEHFAAMYKD